MTLLDLLPLLFLVAAALYSSVGHAGASAYLAAMALAGLAPESMKPTALVINVCVAAITTIQFARIGAVPWRQLAPFLVGSVPATFLAAKLPVPPSLFKGVVGVMLLASALRLLASIAPAKKSALAPERAPRAVWATSSGGAVGVLAGITGTGGGIFLTPLLLLARWADPKPAAGMSAAFILFNSTFGILGKPESLAHLAPNFPLLLGGALVGGVVGSTLGARVFGNAALRGALALVLVIAAAKLFIS